uniref:Predicted protein n=1 Tax=Hordeum vulgare subsp. vulgare TaxID=112509 RepID=F2DEH1_HORVV|nr:predicted protein [Hordeum vulgare subsp. vulgare]
MMSSSTVLTTAILATLLFASSTMGHSQMRCAKYNPQTGDCYAPIRNAGESFTEEAHDISTGQGGLCQKPMSTPITASYSNGPSCGYAPCPLGMGSFTAGEKFYVQWVARNHADAVQTPGNITLYLSPAESVNQGQDVTADVFGQNKFCTAPFMSCNGQNGDLVPCYAPCTFPSNVQPGVYTLWWKWVWPGHTSVYSTCADIYVVASGSNTPTTPSTPSQPSTTGAKVAVPSTTGSKPSTPSTPSTTGKTQPSTTGAKAATAPSTTGAAATPAPTPTPTPVPSSGSSCTTSGYMKCLTSETYSMCNAGSWGPSQSCAVGTQCSPSGNYIYCVIPSKTPVPTPSTPTTPSSSTSSSASDSCVMGSQKCTGTNTYQTCGNGKNGPTWSANQSCQSGLSCHASSTSTNIYCY